MRNIVLLSVIFILSTHLQSQDCPIISIPVNSECGAPPIVSYEADGIATFCENQQVVFINTTFEPEGFYDYFVINWGDGSTLDTIYNYNNVNHTFDFSNIDRCEEGPTITGEYCYVGILNCSDGITSHGQSGYFQVKLRPVADFDFEEVVCVNTEVPFYEDSCNEDSYAWDFNNDGIIDSTDPNPTHSFFSSGSHQVSLTTTNECGSDTRTKTINVVSIPEATIDLGANNGELCVPDFQTITMNANEWVTSGPSGDFDWDISPSSNNNTNWCFVSPDYNGSNQICWNPPTNNSIDSLLSIEEVLRLYFIEPGDYTVTLNYENACLSESISETIHAHEPPEISNIENQSGCDEVEVCYNDLNLTLNGDYESVLWTFTNASVASSNNLNFGCITFQQNGTIQLLVSANDPCMDINETINVNVVTTTSVSVGDIGTICQNGGLVPINPSTPGGNYTYNNSPASFITNDLLDPSGLNPGNYTITYILSDNPDCPAEDNFSFTIQEGPSVTLENNDPECENVSGFNPTIDSYGGDIDSWYWVIYDENWIELMNSPNQNPSFSIDRDGNYNIVATLSSDECGTAMDSSTLIIQANVDVAITTPDNPYCQGSSQDTLFATPSGGTWSGTGISINSEGVFDPSTLSPGTYDITYSIMNGACSASRMSSVVIVASENVTVQDTFFCITDTPGQLSVSPSGGTFIGNGIIDTANGLFDPSQGNTGTNNISYTYIDTNQCEVVNNIIVDVDEIPELNISDTIFICIGNEDIDLTNILTIDTQGETGSFYFTGQGIVNQDEGIFNGASLAMGFYTVTVDFHTRSCSTQDSFVIELAEMPRLTASQDETICIAEDTYTLTASIPGGSWSSTNCIIDPDTGVIDLEASGENNCLFVYTVSPGTSCEQSEEVAINILDLSNDLQVPTANSICYSTDNYIIPNFSPLDGIWSGEALINSSTGIIDVSALQSDTTYTYTYCIESNEIDCPACKDFLLTIEPLPVADFSLDGSPCQGQTFGVNNNSSANATAFTWNFGDGTAESHTPAPTHSYATAGDYTITLTAETAFGCTNVTTQTIHVTSPPTISLSIDTDEGCAPLQVEYTNNSFGENTSQYWLIDGIDTIFEEQPIIILDSVLSDSIITVELVIYNDCEVLRQGQDILVHPYPIVDFGINDDEGCSPDTVFFMDATQGLPDVFLWDFGNGIMSTEQHPDPQIYTSPDDSISTYTISLIASNMCGQDTLEKDILVYPNNVDAFFEIDTLSGCPPLEIQIRNYATQGATVMYDFGDGSTSNLPNITHVYTEPGDYVIKQYASLCGTDMVQSDTITVFPLADIDFDLPTYACVGDTVLFTNLSTNGVVSQWFFGDDHSSDHTNPTHVYDTPGTFTVSLIVNSTFNDCPDTLSKTILIPELPTTAFENTPEEICPNETVSFVNNSTGAINFEWDFGDNSGSDEENPSHTYTTPGIYEVQLTVFDDFGCSVDTTNINMLVHPIPNSDFTFSPNEICQFYDTILINNTSSGFINSIWNLNGNFHTDQQDNLELYFNEFGVQQLELISVNSFGCRDTSQHSFEVLPSPIAQATYDNAVGCQELNLDFEDISQNANLTRWNFDGNNSSNSPLAEHTFIQHGQFQVELIASNTNNCPSDTFLIEVEVYPRAIAEFEILPFDSCGVPLDIEVINSSLYSSDYQWHLGNGSSSNFFEPILTYPTHGYYTITLISTNEHYCADTTWQDIAIYPETQANFEIPETEICERDTLIINNNSVGANAYEWQVNGEIQETFPLVFTESGEYTITLTANFDGYCHHSYVYEIPITVYDSPTSLFAAIIDENSNIIGDVSFINNSINAEAYFWEFGDGNSTSITNPSHEYNIDGPVTVQLFSYQYNNGLFECIDVSNQLIEYERINTFFVPNAMSPDQNFGNTEVGLFKPKGIGIKAYELNIYSPWGDKVATLNQVLNGEPIDHWDGTFEGEPVPQGAYLWVADIKYDNGHAEFKKGNVTVIR